MSNQDIYCRVKRAHILIPVVLIRFLNDILQPCGRTDWRSKALTFHISTGQKDSPPAAFVLPKRTLSSIWLQPRRVFLLENPLNHRLLDDQTTFSNQFFTAVFRRYHFVNLSQTALSGTTQLLIPLTRTPKKCEHMERAMFD